MVEQCYDLDGFAVRIRSPLAELHVVVDRLLGAYRASCSAIDIDVTIEIERPAPTRPAGLPSCSFPPLDVFAAGGEWLLLDDVGWLRTSGARIDGSVRAGAGFRELTGFVRLSLWIALCECFRARNRYGLHAAALISPRGEVALLCGTRGAGKSSAAIALGERGWTVLSDDTVFVEKQAGGVEVLGLLRPFHVRLDWLSRRPDLAAAAIHPEWYEPQDKRALDLAVTTARRASAPVRIYFPRVVAEAHSSVHALSARETLLRLLEHSCFVFVQPELAPAHLDILRSIVDGARAFELRCGRDLLTNPAHYTDMLAEGAVAA